MIASDNALIGTTFHPVAQHIQHRIDDESRETGQTRLSWMAVSHVDEFPGLAIGDPAARLEVGSATAPQLVDRMARRLG